MGVKTSRFHILKLTRNQLIGLRRFFKRGLSNARGEHNGITMHTVYVGREEECVLESINAAFKSGPIVEGEGKNEGVKSKMATLEQIDPALIVHSTKILDYILRGPGRRVVPMRVFLSAWEVQYALNRLAVQCLNTEEKEKKKHDAKNNDARNG